MNYDAYFTGALARLREERRYRVFADLERLAGRFPRAVWHSPQGRATWWCGARTTISAWASTPK